MPMRFLLYCNLQLSIRAIAESSYSNKSLGTNKFFRGRGLGL